jgi:UDP-N-acetylglucosamine/UDP-N-acetylgalactosamine diphosphorylase
LLPFATLGSLINFCDCLLAGGGAADDHSEVGSGFIHFNFSPSGAHGEKATPSLFGDATRGVFLREKRIFLGGDAGVVGPASIGFGTVLAAGTTYRKDRGAGLLVYAERLPDRERPFDPTVFRNAREKIAKNVAYLAQLAALRCFYREVRARLVAEDSFASLLVAAGVETIDSAAKERVKQLEKLAPDFACSAEALAASGDGDGGAEAAFQCAYAERFGAAKAALLDLGGAAAVDADGPHARDFAADVPARGVYLEWVRSLSAQAVERGVRRLTETAARYTAAAARALGL